MGKQLMIDEVTYEKLKRLKDRDKDSFTKVIEDLLGKRYTPRQRLLEAWHEFEAVAEDAIAHNSLQPTLSMMRTLMVEILRDPNILGEVEGPLDEMVERVLKRRKKK